MDSLTAFAAIGLTAVAWEGSLTPAGGRAFRHALDYREPYCSLNEQDMVELMDCLLTRRREIGNTALMLEAANALSSTQSLTAYDCLLYTSPSPRDISGSRMPSSA